MHKTSFLGALAFGLLTIGALDAQSPAPVILQATTPVPGPAIAPPSSSSTGADAKSMMQLLEEMRATNANTIKKQELTLQNIDLLQKAAEELKIFSKRG